MVFLANQISFLENLNSLLGNYKRVRFKKKSIIISIKPIIFKGYLHIFIILKCLKI